MLGSKKILIIYSDRDQTKSAAMALRAAGFQVLLSVDGPQAVRIARENDPQAIIVNVRPAANESSAILNFIADQQALGSRTPVVIVTNEGPHACGPTIAIPVDAVELVATVTGVIQVAERESTEMQVIPPLSHWDRLENELEKDLARIAEVLRSFDDAASGVTTTETSRVESETNVELNAGMSPSDCSQRPRATS